MTIPESTNATPAALPFGMKAWGPTSPGYPMAPDDWNRGPVMFANGNVFGGAAGRVWKLGWDHSYGDGNVIAYTPLATPSVATPADDAGVPGEKWPADWKRYGFNHAITQAQKALRYLASNDRPGGGEQFPNSASCYMIADELEVTRKRYEALAASPKAPSVAGEAIQLAYKTGHSEGYIDATDDGTGNGYADRDAAEEGWQQYKGRLNETLLVPATAAADSPDDLSRTGSHSNAAGSSGDTSSAVAIGEGSWTGDPHGLANELRRVANLWRDGFRLPQLLRDAADEIDCLAPGSAPASASIPADVEREAVWNAVRSAWFSGRKTRERSYDSEVVEKGWDRLVDAALAARPSPVERDNGGAL